MTKNLIVNIKESKFFNTRDEYLEHIDQQISSVGSEQSGFINLSSLNLFKIPEVLQKVEDKFWLDLSSNSLSEIPDWFYDLDNIQFLNLSRNKFTQFPIRLLSMKSIIKIVPHRFVIKYKYMDNFIKMRIK